MLRSPDLTRRFQELLRSAVKTGAGHFAIGPRQLYILPSRYGLMYAALLIAMLIGSINYANNLGFLLTFFLAAIGIITMVHSWLNLLDLQLQIHRLQPVFAGQPLLLKVEVFNASDRMRGSLRITAAGFESSFVEQDIEPDSNLLFILSLPTKRRGPVSISQLKISSHFPFGLFTAWCYVRQPVNAIVYPQPSLPYPLQFSYADENSANGSRGEGNEDFHSHRNYFVSDSPRHIDWKVFAREKGLKVKQFAGSETATLWFSLEQFRDKPLEQAISLLTRGIIEADKNGFEYGLILAGEAIPLATGHQQKQRCLKALALFGL